MTPYDAGLSWQILTGDAVQDGIMIVKCYYCNVIETWPNGKRCPLCGGDLNHGTCYYGIILQTNELVTSAWGYADQIHAMNRDDYHNLVFFDNPDYIKQVESSYPQR